MQKIPYDKKLHFIAGLLIFLAVSIAISPTCGLLTSMIAGVAKEIKDYLDYGSPDVIDCLATWLGGGNCGVDSASNSLGVRPAFGIK